jgi:hypothetical protein
MREARFTAPRTKSAEDKKTRKITEVKNEKKKLLK